MHAIVSAKGLSRRCKIVRASYHNRRLRLLRIPASPLVAFEASIHIIIDKSREFSRAREFKAGGVKRLSIFMIKGLAGHRGYLWTFLSHLLDIIS